jgi:hypothetical protein
MSVDIGVVLLTGSFSGTGQSNAVAIWGDFNLNLSGTFSATVQLERSFDSQVTWTVVATDGIGTPAIYNKPIGLLGLEVEPGVYYRLNCTGFSSGPLNYRLSQSPYRPIGTLG